MGHVDWVSHSMVREIGTENTEIGTENTELGIRRGAHREEEVVTSGGGGGFKRDRAPFHGLAG